MTVKEWRKKKQDSHTMKYINQQAEGTNLKSFWKVCSLYHPEFNIIPLSKSLPLSPNKHSALERVLKKLQSTCLHWLWWRWNYKVCQLSRGKTDQRASKADMEQRRGREQNRKGYLFSLGTSIWYSAAQTQSLPTSTHHKPVHLALLKEPYECPSSKTIL